MLKTNNDTKTISVNRGDQGQSFDFSIPIDDGSFYTFQVGDVIMFGVYNRNKLNEDALLLKEYTIDEAKTKVTLNFDKDDFVIGDLINKPVIYWYEIQLNNNTIIGYDENGAKEFILYPEGSDIKW